MLSTTVEMRAPYEGTVDSSILPPLLAAVCVVSLDPYPVRILSVNQKANGGRHRCFAAHQRGCKPPHPAVMHICDNRSGRPRMSVVGSGSVDLTMVFKHEQFLNPPENLGSATQVMLPLSRDDGGR
jgi:hypothetical protein